MPPFSSSDRPPPPSSIRAYRALILLERHQRYYLTRTGYRTVIYTFVLFIHTLIPAHTASAIILQILGWSLILLFTGHRTLTTRLIIPTWIALFFRGLFSLYLLLRGTSPDGDWRDKLVVGVLTGCWASVMWTYYNLWQRRVWDAAGTKGLLVVQWRRDYEEKISRVFRKNEEIMRGWCSEVVGWVVFGGAEEERVLTEETGGDWLLWNSTLLSWRKCAPVVLAEERNEKRLREYERAKRKAAAADQAAAPPAPPVLEPVPDVPEGVSKEVFKHFRELYRDGAGTYRGFYKNARDLMHMEPVLLGKNRRSLGSFTVVPDRDVEEWCLRVWDEQHLPQRPELQVFLARRLRDCWKMLWQEVVGGREPKLGDRLPVRMQAALRYVLMVTADGWEETVKADMEEDMRKRAERKKREGKRRGEAVVEEFGAGEKGAGVIFDYGGEEPAGKADLEEDERRKGEAAVEEFRGGENAGVGADHGGEEGGGVAEEVTEDLDCSSEVVTPG